MHPLLSIQNLSIDFINNSAVNHALQDVSFEVNKGEIVAIVGESGSGKSITSLAVLQLLPTPPAIYKSGKIVFYEDDITTNLLTSTQDEMQEIRGNKIAMIFQEPMTSLNPVHTCGNQVAEAIRVHKNTTAEEAKLQTIALFEKVQLPNPAQLYHKYPHEISGGQKQRVMIAMAMSCSPSLLICDEPTTALDVTVQKNILDLIRQLQQQNNMGVIFISHDLGVIAGIADKIVVLYKGKVVEQANKEQLFSNPQHPYTKALLACRPALYHKNQRLPVVCDFLQDPSETHIQHITQTHHSTVAVAKEKPLLKLEHLKVWYPSRTSFMGKVLEYNKAVDDVSFQIYTGETIGLVGESGCGKTTIGRAIAGLLKATTGSIYFDSIDLVTASTQQWQQLRKDIQIIFQDPYSSLNPRKTIGEAIAEPLKVHGLSKTEQLRKARVMELLEKVSLLPEHYYRYPHEFSGGQRQRIVIARALALEPRFVICDESVSALDVSVQAQVLNLLNDLKKDFGFTALFISHDLSVVKYISDRIVVMNKGKIVETGNAEELYYHPKEPYTQKLISSIPTLSI